MVVGMGRVDWDAHKEPLAVIEIVYLDWAPRAGQPVQRPVLSLPILVETHNQPRLPRTHNPTLPLGFLGTEGNASFIDDY